MATELNQHYPVSVNDDVRTAAREMYGALFELLTRVRLEMRTGGLPINWADPTILRARSALAMAHGEAAE